MHLFGLPPVRVLQLVALAAQAAPGQAPATAPATPAADAVTVSQLPGQAVPTIALVPQPSGHLQAGAADEKTVRALASFEGASWVGPLPGNGNREVAILVPPGIDPSRPVEVITLFPGVDANLRAGRDSAVRRALEGNDNFRAAILTLGTARNAVIVMPRNRYDGLDMRTSADPTENLATLQQSVTDVLQRQWQLRPESQTVIGYSYGGQPVMNAAESGQFLPGTRFGLLDAAYTWQSTGDIGQRISTALSQRAEVHNWHLTTPAIKGDQPHVHNHTVTGTTHALIPRRLPDLLKAALPD